MERRALKRVWVPPSRVAAEPRIHTSPSLPLRELLRDGRPLFECASCGFSHDRGFPMCLWCLWTDDNTTRAWAATAPRARTLSAPSTINRQLINITGTTTKSHRANNPTSVMPSRSTMRPSTAPNPRPNPTHAHDERFLLPRPASPYTSRPSTPDSVSATSQPKYAAYVARKAAQRHSMLVRISERATAAAVDVPRPETPPQRAPTPGSIALGVLLPIPGSLVVTSHRDSVASSSGARHRDSSAWSVSSGLGGPSRSSMDVAGGRTSMDSSRSKHCYKVSLDPHSESDDEHEPPPEKKKPEKRFGTLLRRVSNAVRGTTRREKRFFPVTWGKSR